MENLEALLAFAVQTAQAEILGETDIDTVAMLASREHMHFAFLEPQSDAPHVRYYFSQYLRRAVTELDIQFSALVSPVWLLDPDKVVTYSACARAEAEQLADIQAHPDRIEALVLSLASADTQYLRGFRLQRDPHTQQVIGFDPIQALNNRDSPAEVQISGLITDLFSPMDAEVVNNPLVQALYDAHLAGMKAQATPLAQLYSPPLTRPRLH